MSKRSRPIARDLIAIGIFLSSVIPAAAQVQPPTVPRDRPRPDAKGTASISGRVVDGATGAPLARARVVLQGGPQRPSIITDSSGRFTFSELLGGGYVVNADKSTYMPARFPEAGQTLRAQAKRFTVEDGHSVTNVTLRMFRGGAITGRVFDANGDPVEYVEVRALRLTAAGTRSTPRGGGGTNDIGEFRVARLEPGSYLLMAVGRRIGGFDDGTSSATPPPVQIPTYYPGVLSVDQAQPITVARGQTVSDVDITLLEGTAAIVSGTVVGEDGQPVPGNGMVVARTAVRDGNFGMEGGGTSIKPDGTFRFTLAPGDYTFEARLAGRPPVSGVISGVPGGERFGMVRATVAGNLEGLTIVVGNGATATGKVIFEGTSPIPPVPPGGQFRLPLSAPDGSCRQGQTTVRPDWTFRVEGLAGTCTAMSQMMGFGAWVLKSVTMGDQDLLREPVTFETGQRLGDVVVVLTDKRGSIGFDVVDERGEPTTEYVALVYPVSSAGSLMPNARTFVPTARTFPNSSESNLPGTAAGSLGGLPAGEYYAIAVDDIGYEDMQDRALFRRLTSSATRVTIGETPTTRVSLRRVALAEAIKRDR